MTNPTPTSAAAMTDEVRAVLTSFLHEFGDKANNNTVRRARALLAQAALPEVEAAQAQAASAPTGQPSDKVYCTACDMTTQDKERCSDCPRRTARWYADATPVHATSAAVRAEAAQQKLTREYRRNILEGVANWMRSRHSTIWAKEFGYTGLMATWADALDQIRRELSGVQPTQKTSLRELLEAARGYVRGGSNGEGDVDADALLARIDAALSDSIGTDGVGGGLKP